MITTPATLALGAVLVVSVASWRLASATYPHDLDVVCTAEERSGSSLRRDMAGVTLWTRAHLRTPEGNRLFSSLRDLPIGQRGRRLRDEANANGVCECPTASTYDQLAREADYRHDVQKLCSYVTFPSLSTLDDDERVSALAAFIDDEATSERAQALGDLLKTRPPPAQAARLLRDAAREIDILTCDNAKVLETPANGTCVDPSVPIGMTAVPQR